MLFTDIYLTPLMPVQGNNFGGSLVLDLENDDVTCNPRTLDLCLRTRQDYRNN